MLRNTWISSISGKLSSPFILALSIAILIIVFLPEGFDKYEVTLIKVENAYKENSLEEYVDLDGDGVSERIVVYHNRKGFPSLQVLNNKDVLVDQWNFTGKLTDFSEVYHCSDLDKNGYHEIYIITLSNDSLMLNAIEPFPRPTIKFRNKYICTIWKYNNEVDVTLGNMNDCDLDGDGVNELIFKVKAGYSKQPRGIFAYNLITDKFIRTPTLGANINQIIIADLNEDSHPEFYCSCSTLGNIHDSLGIPFNDYSSWFMTFYHELKPLFQAVEFPFYPSALCQSKFQIPDGKSYIAVIFNNKSKSDKLSMVLYDDNGACDEIGAVLNQSGDSLDECSLMKDVIIGDEQMLLLRHGEHYSLLNSNLEILETENFEKIIHFVLFEDLDNDGEKEMIFTSRSGLLITKYDFSYPVEVDNFIDPYGIPPYKISMKYNGTKPPELFFCTGGLDYFYTYQKNLYYTFKYLIWFAIYAGAILIVFIYGRIQTRQLRKRMETDKLINSLKIKTIKNQISPHFTFNAINSISGIAISGNMDRLHYYTNRYTSLMRRLLEDADKISISLQEEIDFTLDYLEIQMMRFEEEFEYNLNISDDVDMDILVPRTMIHTFVENAIKYGLRGLDGKGILDIIVESNKKIVTIFIQDNGNGRQQSSAGNSTGKGLKIIDELFELYKKVEGHKIEWNIVDLEENGKPIGTRIVLILKRK